MYGVIYFFPNTIVQLVNNNLVTVTDKGINEGVNKVYDSVVVVKTISKDSGEIGTGTGFVYKTEGNNAFVMTNHHVINGGTEYKLIFSDNREVNATLIGSDEYADIAVLKVKKDDITLVATLGSNESTKIGDTVFTIGAPLGLEYAGTVTRGILSGKDRLVEVSISGYSSDWIMNVMQTDAAINPGNSGGPLCNVNGEVIGINSLKIAENEVEGLGFSIPIEDALSYANAITKKEKIERPYVGIQMLETTAIFDLIRAGINLDKDSPKGVVITSIIENSPASKSKLEIGDIITKINNYETNSIAKFRYYLYKFDPKEKIELTVYRKGKTKKIEITLDKSE